MVESKEELMYLSIIRIIHTCQSQGNAEQIRQSLQIHPSAPYSRRILTGQINAHEKTEHDTFFRGYLYARAVQQLCHLYLCKECATIRLGNTSCLSQFPKVLMGWAKS